MFISCLRGDLPAGLSRWRLVQLPPLRDRGQRPRPWSPRCTYGVVAARRPPMSQNRPTTHVPQPLLHLGTPLRASLALYGW